MKQDEFNIDFIHLMLATEIMFQRDFEKKFKGK